MNKNILSEVNKMRKHMNLGNISEEAAAKSSIINESVGSGDPFEKKVEGGKMTDAKEGSVNTPAEESKHTGNGAGSSDPFEKKTEGGKLVNENEDQPFEKKVEGGKMTDAKEGGVNTPAEESKHTGNGAGSSDPFEKKTEGGKLVNESEDEIPENPEDYRNQPAYITEEEPMEDEPVVESNENMAEIGGVKFNGENRSDNMNEGVDVTNELNVLNEAASAQLANMKKMIKLIK